MTDPNLLRETFLRVTGIDRLARYVLSNKYLCYTVILIAAAYVFASIACSFAELYGFLD